jgi:hypothetical protein
MTVTMFFWSGGMMNLQEQVDAMREYLIEAQEQIAILKKENQTLLRVVADYQNVFYLIPERQPAQAMAKQRSSDNV